MTGRILDVETLARELATLREQGKRIVTTNGVFDLLHRGHRFLFRQCRELGDVVVVGVNSDASAIALKSKTPIDRESQRALNVARHVDYVFIFDELDPLEWLPKLRPDVHATASTYGHDCVEAPVLRQIGAELALVPVKPEFGSSTLRRARLMSRRRFLSGPASLVVRQFLALCAQLLPIKDRVLIVPRRGLGDVLQATPIFRALKRSFPDTEVHVLTSERWVPLLEQNRNIDHLIVRSTRSPISLTFELWRQHYRAVLNLERRGYGLALWLSARSRVTVRWPVTRAEPPSLDASLANTTIVRAAWDERVHDTHMRAVAALGAHPVDPRLDAPVSARAEESTRSWLEGHGLRSRSFVIVNPSAANAIKEWPTAHWDALIRRIVAERGLPVVVSTAKRYHAHRLSGMEGTFDASSLRLDEMAALCSHAACFVSVDTGPLYVAHARGCPLIVIVGIVIADKQLPPPGDDVVHVLPPPDTTAWDVSPEGRERALAGTSVDAVFAATVGLLSRTGERPGAKIGPDSVA